ncbi:hypothetical protein, partial [Priestia megaterium]|uniref:hypothetical protein n=1 Tax=Priestia megaterium TaxID=1404 RepID=UPI0035B5A933
RTDIVVTLSASAPQSVQLPAQVTVPAGQDAVTVPLTALDVGEATLTATLDGQSIDARVQVIDAELVAIAIEPKDTTLA